MWVSNTFGWSVTSRHNLLLCSMFTRLVVGRGLLRPFFFDDMFEPKTKKRELDSESTQTRSKFQEKNIRVLSLSLSTQSRSTQQRRHEEEDTKKLRKRHANRQRSLLLLWGNVPPSAFSIRVAFATKSVLFLWREVEEFVVVVVPVCIRIKPKVSVVRLPKKLKIWRGHKNTLIRRE